MAMAKDRPASRFGTVEIDDLPDDLRERLAPIVERSGFTPNIFRALGRRPAELRAFLDYHDALMTSDEGLSKAAALLGQLVIKEKPEAAWWV